jgi:hypothetical protein
MAGCFSGHNKKGRRQPAQSPVASFTSFLVVPIAVSERLEFANGGDTLLVDVGHGR